MITSTDGTTTGRRSLEQVRHSALNSFSTSTITPGKTAPQAVQAMVHWEHRSHENPVCFYVSYGMQAAHSLSLVEVRSRMSDVAQDRQYWGTFSRHYFGSFFYPTGNFTVISTVQVPLEERRNVRYLEMVRYMHRICDTPVPVPVTGNTEYRCSCYGQQ